MDIEIISATGEGPTTLAAFHSALAKAGIENMNLITLSSVIPASAKITTVKKTGRQFKYGNRLYVVMSRNSTQTLMEHVYSGVGWYQRPDGSGYFVEHHGDSEESVREKIDLSLNHIQHMRNENYPIHREIIGTVCKKTPVCSLVVAIYEDEDWKS